MMVSRNTTGSKPSQRLSLFVLFGLLASATAVGALDITCASSASTRSYCEADTSKGVSLVRVLEGSNCDGNWGFDAQGVWVQNGCKAEFSLGSTEAKAGNVDLISSLVGALVGPQETPSQRMESQDSGRVVRGVCESIDLKRAFCKVNTAGGVRMVRQISRSSCEGNWGYTPEGVWVTNGCRAEFEVQILEATPVPPTATPAPVSVVAREKLVCESKNSRRAFCSADTSGGVSLLRTLGSVSCTGRWGYDSNGIWVDEGCRGEFEISRSTSSPTPPPEREGKKIICGSMDGRRAFCAADTSQGVRFLRQVGRHDCTGNWGYNSDGIWVDNSCEAEFLVAEPEPTKPAGPVKVVCRAKGTGRQYCDARVTTLIKLVKQVGEGECVGNWGFDPRGLWVQNRCEAQFLVQ